MKKQENRRYTDKPIRFSIGAKLVIIITILVLVSLGIITLLVSYFVRDDLKTSAKENNLNVNRRTAAEVEYTLANVYSNSTLILEIINSAGVDSMLAKQAEELFFERNRQIAALNFPVSGRKLINHNFFSRNEIEESLIYSFFEINNDTLRQAAAGKVVFLNASPHFKSNLLALFFSNQGGGSISILFWPDNLNESFNSGLNETYLINNDGDILIHTDFELVQTGANISKQSYIRSIRENPLGSMHSEDTDEDGKSYFTDYRKLDTFSCIAITRIESFKVFEEINATTRRNMYLTGAVLSFSVLFIWFFSKTISSPLKILAKSAQRIEGGSFEVNLKAKSRDEIGLLTASFKRMSTALGIFGRFTNREIAIKAMRGEIKPGGMPKHATVFFSDIRGFTEKSESFTREFRNGASDKIVYWLNAYLTQMVECVVKTNGVVDKFIGDAVMAHWGTAYTAGSPARDAFNCVKAALMMRKALVFMNMNRRPQDLGNPPIAIGCGINTGVVTAGQIGSDLRMEYTVIGDPVNLASRIEALNKPFGTDILISEDTWNLVKYFFLTEEMPSVTVKGKEKPVRIFAVVNHVAVTAGPRNLPEVRKLLGVKAPDISKVDTNAEETKYKIGAGE
jgi:adenylate cyclase